ncbi:putative familial paroxysmal dyskinesia fpd1 [Golovinomyces cichoracearum]|uniref:Putative familial paroxysmal dyskinesia fpd1 n=1 Tax=Golovinomyces cichoracearum TaxID=62708 RepID=A0A420HIC8_9PEZI|nr:putative familial paroxysmal dyskinesia fpd1 [Golovinomyces cichoracearum]
MLPQTPVGVTMQKLPARIFIKQNNKSLWSLPFNSKRSDIHLRTSNRHPDQKILNFHSCSAGLTSDLKTTDLKPPRAHLRSTLIELQKHASGYVNSSKLKLALRGLEQKCGEETIRVAILRVAGERSSLKRAIEILRLLAADPSKPEEEWELNLLSGDSQAVLLKSGPDDSEGILKEDRFLREFQVPSPVLKRHNLEILVLESDPPKYKMDEESFEDSLLVPSIKIPGPGTGRYNILRTPAHKALVISEGLIGATKILNFPININRQNIIGVAIDLKVSDNQNSSISSLLIDVDLATRTLENYRKGREDLLSFEKNWASSGLPKIVSWLGKGSLSSKSEMRMPLRDLIGSIIQNSTRAIENEKAQRLTLMSSTNASRSEIAKLQKELNNWASRSHVELRDSLEIAFKGRKWRKLCWWKLFWRVDDISTIATNILNQHFLTAAEQEAIYLAGRIEERVNSMIQDSAFLNSWDLEPKSDEISKAKLGCKPLPPQLITFVPTPKDLSHFEFRPQPWPQEIPASRSYLSQQTIPSLQTLGQRLVMKVIYQSSLTIALSGLIYVSTKSFGFYEVGAVATLGIVFSLRRMQINWEKARESWEGLVREEGRKALRCVEGSLHKNLTQEKSLPVDNEIEKANAAVLAVKKAIQALR